MKITSGVRIMNTIPDRKNKFNIGDTVQMKSSYGLYAVIVGVDKDWADRVIYEVECHSLNHPDGVVRSYRYECDLYT